MPDPKTNTTDDRRRLVIHIGYHRTGTSFLQTELFALLGDLIPAPAVPKARPIVDLCNRMEPSTAVVTDDVVVYSNENLSGSFDTDRPELAAELRAVTGEARIIMTIRSQYAIFKAFYFLYLKGGGCAGFAEFVGQRIGKVCNYYRLFQAYEKEYGKGSVLVLCQEDLLGDPLQSMTRVLDFIGVDRKFAEAVSIKLVKPSAQNSLLKIMLLRNRLLKKLSPVMPDSLARRILFHGVPGHRILARLFGDASAIAAMDPAMQAEIQAMYGADNSALFREAGIDQPGTVYPVEKVAPSLKAAE